MPLKVNTWHVDQALRHRRRHHEGADDPVTLPMVTDMTSMTSGCVTDSRLGMTPPRRHSPAVEEDAIHAAEFEQLAPR